MPSRLVPVLMTKRGAVRPRAGADDSAIDEFPRSVRHPRCASRPSTDTLAQINPAATPRSHMRWRCALLARPPRRARRAGSWRELSRASGTIHEGRSSGSRRARGLRATVPSDTRRHATWRCRGSRSSRRCATARAARARSLRPRPSRRGVARARRATRCCPSSATRSRRRVDCDRFYTELPSAPRRGLRSSRNSLAPAFFALRALGSRSAPDALQGTRAEALRSASSA